MKILYFDTFSLFYSQTYIESDKNVSMAYEEWRNSPLGNLLTEVRPDLTGIKKLRKAAIESGFKLYSLDNRYKRALLIEMEIFTEEDLAPDCVFSIRMGDGDPIRRMIAHSQVLGATWFVCGDVDSEVFSYYPKRHLKSAFGLGVTDELISQIRALKTT